METTIMSIICLALIVTGSMTMSQGFLSSVDNTSSALSTSSERGEQIMRTDVSASAELQAANRVDVTVANDGQTKLASFDKWDVIVQYYPDGGGYQVKWLPYTSGALGNNQWTVEGIYVTSNGDPEVIEPDILNPGEEMVIRIQLSPAVAHQSVNMVTISTPSGITASSIFTRN